MPTLNVIMFITPTTSPIEKIVGTPCGIVALNYVNCWMTLYSTLKKNQATCVYIFATCVYMFATCVYMFASNLTANTWLSIIKLIYCNLEK
jgi:hypothetical protein